MALRSITKSRWFGPAILFAASAAALLFLPPLVGLGGLVVAFLWLVARFDNRAGVFLPLAVLLLVVLALMVLLLAGMAYVHALMTGAR